jgi:hypothetical protein
MPDTLCRHSGMTLTQLQLRQHHLHDLRRFGRQTLHGFCATQTFQHVLQALPQRANFLRLPIVLHHLRDLIHLPARWPITLRTRDDKVEDAFEDLFGFLTLAIAGQFTTLDRLLTLELLQKLEAAPY